MTFEPEHYSNPMGWTIVLYGLVLSFISAFTPFFTTGYQFQLELMLAGFTPYLIYTIAVPLLVSATTTTVGAGLAAVHTSTVVAVRFFGSVDSLMYTVPGILSLLVIPLAIVALRKSNPGKPWRWITRH